MDEEPIQSLLTWTEAEKEVFSKEQMEICEMKIRGDFNSVIYGKISFKVIIKYNNCSCFNNKWEFMETSRWCWW